MRFWLVGLVSAASFAANLITTDSVNYAWTTPQCRLGRNDLTISLGEKQTSGSLSLRVRNFRSLLQNPQVRIQGKHPAVTEVVFKDRDGDTWVLPPRVFSKSVCDLAFTKSENIEDRWLLSMNCSGLIEKDSKIPGRYGFSVPANGAIACNGLR